VALGSLWPSSCGRWYANGGWILRAALIAALQIQPFIILNGAESGDAAADVSLLLIELMLWTHFVSEGDDVRTQVHVSGPQAGDLVVISGEEVIREIAKNRLSIGEAYPQGLIRLYGTEEQVRSFLIRYDQVGSERSN
jgi:hypothetical protein